MKQDRATFSAEKTYNNYPSESDYMQMLEPFALYSEPGWKKNYLGNNMLGYFGESSHVENGMRSMGNYIFTTCLLASEESYNPEVSGVDRQVLLNRAKCCLGYMTRSHVTGDITCGNGRKWGGAWQSAWWTTKMALGARLIWNQLSKEEKAGVEKVVVSEASRHLDRILPSGLVGDTKAEENAWDTEILATATALFPEHKLHTQWREKIVEFSLNTLSVSQDLTSEAIVDGRKLHEQVYTVNLHSDYTLENHGACHFCYVASPLLSVAWSYYALFSSGQPVPDALFHHVKDLWDRTKSTFLDSRFAYIGGKDWARYTYGLYFIVPALVMLQKKYGDTDARTIEIARIKTLAQEQKDNGNGSFFGKRVTHGQMFGQSAKYETDCYANLGLAYLLHKLLSTDKQPTPSQNFISCLSSRHISQESGTCYVRTPKLFASFCWKTLTEPYPIALFIPSGMDDAAEWTANNLTGRVAVFGDVTNTGLTRAMKESGEGFKVQGVLNYWTKNRKAFVHRISYNVIPEKNLAIVENKFIASSKILVTQSEGLRLAIANDCFNGYTREFKWDGGAATITFPYRAKNKVAELLGLGMTNTEFGRSWVDIDEKLGTILFKANSARNKVTKLLGLGVVNKKLGRSWVNVDEKLGIIQLKAESEPFNLRQEPGRNTPSSCLHYEILNSPKPILRPKMKRAGEVILHTKFMILAGTAAETEALARAGGIVS